MKISREKASQRLYHRVSTPLSIQIDGKIYAALDWSLGGFRLKDWDIFDGSIKTGDIVSCIFDLPFQGFDITFDIQISVVRVDEENKQLATKFIDLDDRQIELMNHFVEQLVRGAMVPIGDTILRIDSPVTPVSTKPDPNPMQQIPTSRINLKMIIMSFLYISIGFFLFVLVSITIFENFMSIKVKTAVVNLDLETVVSLSDGRIENVRVSENDFMYPGEPMLSINSPSISKQLAESKIKIEHKKIELESLRRTYEVEFEAAASPNSKLLKLLKIEIDTCKAQIALENENLLALYDYKDKLNITSPAYGTLTKLYRKQGATVNKGDTIAIFERNAKPYIHAYLTHEEASEVTLGLYTKVRLLSQNRTLVGKVVDLQSDHLNELSYRPINDKTRTILVKIELQLDGLNITSTNNYSNGIVSPSLNRLNLKMGAPVEVLFPTTGISRKIINYYADSQFKNNKTGIAL
ncbi:MAG: efflux RND transporter periplasmic adaptor subunit [Saccharospirillaceae bacterium]|nr:efflux RND transporter periplasmic adaptor subunit [Pseudomonadales bacterium]NRB77716.1 efflux RND transporter periplasmic adaptor subunit [Saccharospirillaceae bacterium]